MGRRDVEAVGRASVVIGLVLAHSSLAELAELAKKMLGAKLQPQAPAIRHI